MDIPIKTTAEIVEALAVTEAETNKEFDGTADDQQKKLLAWQAHIAEVIFADIYCLEFEKANNPHWDQDSELRRARSAYVAARKSLAYLESLLA